jgi:TRAP-type C4-dicarboxylate transport system permease small subunit
MSPANLKKTQVFINMTILVFALLGMLVGGVRLVYITLVLEQLSPSLKIPLGVVYSVIPISGILIIFYKILDLKKQVQ